MNPQNNRGRFAEQFIELVVMTKLRIEKALPNIAYSFQGFHI